MNINIIFTYFQTQRRVVVELVNKQNTIALTGVRDGFLVDMVRELWRDGKTSLTLELQEGFEYLGSDLQQEGSHDRT